MLHVILFLADYSVALDLENNLKYHCEQLLCSQHMVIQQNEVQFVFNSVGLGSLCESAALLCNTLAIKKESSCQEQDLQYLYIMNILILSNYTAI